MSPGNRSNVKYGLEWLYRGVAIFLIAQVYFKVDSAFEKLELEIAENKVQRVQIDAHEKRLDKYYEIQLNDREEIDNIRYSIKNKFSTHN